MYFPYLYGRRAELLALRDIAPQLPTWGTVTPVIEPVKLDAGDLKRCLDEVTSAGAEVFVIINPSQGDLQSEGNQRVWKRSLEGYLGSGRGAIPTFQVTSDVTPSQLEGFIREYAGERIGLAVRTTSIVPDDLRAHVDGTEFTAFIHTSVNPSRYSRALSPDRTVIVNDSFRVQARNADYEGEEWFTGEHREYREAGRPGFSDFGPLPNSFRESGGRMAAAAIHLSYQGTDGDIWIQHFVSDSRTRDHGTSTTKIAEATAYVAQEVSAQPSKFRDSVGLRQFLQQHDDEAPASPMNSKRQQISHHVTTVASAI